MSNLTRSWGIKDYTILQIPVNANDKSNDIYSFCVDFVQDQIVI